MKIPPLTAEKIVKILLNKNFEIKRRKGSHIQLEDDEGRRVTVPMHPGRKTGKGLLRKIMRDAELSREELIKLIEEV